MTFEEAKSYLFSLGNEVSAMKLGLENIRTLLDALGKPHEKYLRVQVAGTNGKGSVCAFLDSICREAGVKAGLYTSPHLVSITERVKIGGVDISEAEFARLATDVRETAERLLADGTLEYRPTFFEQMTAIALVAFAESNVELAILETGLGGRLDATTAANAEIAVMTRIDLDHQEYLGDDLKSISTEKAAIIHGGSKVVVCEQSRIAMKVIRERCKTVGAKARTTAEFLGQGFGLPRLGLLGEHQVENAEVAILAAYTLRDHFDISDEAVVAGLENARHPGRLEYFGRYLFDGAHNIGGAKALAEYLIQFEKRPITMVFGAMRDKEIAEIASILFPLAAKIVLTEPENSRSMTYSELLEKIPDEISRSNIFATDRVEKALTIAETVTPDIGIILVTGSLYLVGEVKQVLE